MELRVWTDQVERVILNADEETTCRDVIFTLATITKITGCYTLIGQHADNFVEFLLAPSDKPLKLLKERKEHGQSSLRFLLRHSKRTQPITQLAYHVRQPNRSERSADTFLYNREAFKGTVPNLRRRHTSICVPNDWRKFVKKPKLSENLFKYRAVDELSNTAKERTDLTSNRTVSNLNDRTKSNLSPDNNNNKNSEVENDSKLIGNQVELVLYLTEANVYTQNNPKGIIAESNTFQTRTTFSAETGQKPIRSYDEANNLNRELNANFKNNKKLEARRTSTKVEGSNKVENDFIIYSKDGGYLNDSLEKMVIDNSFAESDLDLNRTNGPIISTSKPQASNTRPASQEPVLNKKYFEVIESLDDFLDKESQGQVQSKKLLKKISVGPKTGRSEARTDGDLSYKQKLTKFRQMEQGEQLSNDLHKRLLNRNVRSDRANEINNYYAEHVDSEIKDLKIEVEQNEKAAKKLEKSIKQMQTNLKEFYDETKPSIEIKDRTDNQITRIEHSETDPDSTNAYFYPSEQFLTLQKAEKGTSNLNKTDDLDIESETRRSQTGTDSLNQQFLFLLQDNRKGYLV